mgnify:FL=1
MKEDNKDKKEVGSRSRTHHLDVLRNEKIEERIERETHVRCKEPHYIHPINKCNITFFYKQVLNNNSDSCA